MLKKAFLSAVLLVFVFLVCGCGTVYQGTSGFVKGVGHGTAEFGKGLCNGTTGLGKGVKEGAKGDWNWLVNSIHNSDAWVKDNLW